jgi:hypothetical protein
LGLAFGLRVRIAKTTPLELLPSMAFEHPNTTNWGNSSESGANWELRIPMRLQMTRQTEENRRENFKRGEGK